MVEGKQKQFIFVKCPTCSQRSAVILPKDIKKCLVCNTVFLVGKEKEKGGK